MLSGHGPANAVTDEYVAILDAGSQFGKLIDRKVRELNVEARILPLETPAAVLAADPQLRAIIISGGPNSVYAPDAPTYDSALFEGPKPVLGICYGLQMLVKHFGGAVEAQTVREDGQDEIKCDLTSPLFTGLAEKELVLLTHGDSVSSVNDPLQIVARSSGGIIAAVQHMSLPFYGVQFHPEVDLSINGVAMLRNFLTSAGCHFGFTMEDREQVAIQYIRDRVGQGSTKVLCLASGGVDSTVCASLLLKALGPERVVCIHIDHGFMRKNESAEVCTALAAVGVNVHVVDAVEDFARATTTLTSKDGISHTSLPLREAINPEEKRRIIGDTFMHVSDAAIKNLALNPEELLLAQGTLRPDLIESGSHLASKRADAIKTHHNDTELVRQLRAKGRIIEPLCDYHKDEVRVLGKALGLPEHLVMRQPFPGPGLAIRILCAAEPYLTDDMSETEELINTILDASSASPFLDGLRDAIKCLQATAVLLPVRSVGVQGDGRTYNHAVGISIPSGSPTPNQWELLLQIAKIIPKLARKINRVVFTFGPPVTKAPRSITKTTLVPEVIGRIREAGNVVGELLIKHNLVRALSQVPVVLVPVGFGDDTKHSVVIRTFLTSDFMTGIPATPGTAYLPIEALGEMVSALAQLPFVARVMFDLTAKPPGTTEWE